MQLFPGRDTFEFDQGYVTKNQPITVPVLLSESLAIYHVPLVKMVTEQQPSKILDILCCSAMLQI